MEKCELEKLLEKGEPQFLITKDDEIQSTFELDESLPSLPVPDLIKTVDLYLDSVRAIAESDEEYRRTEFIAMQFLANEGPQLHKMLLDFASTRRNWLDEWWHEFAYLRSREPTMPFCMMSGAGPFHRQKWPPQEGTQLRRAAQFLYYDLRYWQIVRQKRLPVDRRASGEPLSMYQYRKYFNTVKVPGEEVDELVHYFRTIDEGDPYTHVIVGCQGRLFIMNATKDKAGEVLLTPPELERKLMSIRKYCDEVGPGVGLGALPALGRTEWARTRDHLINMCEHNRHTFHLLDTALMCIVLSDSCPTTDDELIQDIYLPVDPGSFWCDKAGTMVITKNGLTGSVNDHAPYDAMVMVSSCFYVDTNVWKETESWGPAAREIDNDVEEITLQLDDVGEDALQAGRRNWAISRESVDVRSVEFLDFGRKELRKLGLHPDTVVQLAIQLSYIRLYGRPAATYQTATTRRFYRARTETIRSCTPEVVRWARRLCYEKNSQEDKWTPSDTVVKLFTAAHKKHNWLRAECEAGRGCDRHLLGLDIMAAIQGLPRPGIFQDPMWRLAGGDGNYILSTSFIGYTTVHGFVSPMCSHGYGVFYRIGQECVKFAITTWTKDQATENGPKMFRALTDSLRDIYRLCTAQDRATFKSKL